MTTDMDILRLRHKEIPELTTFMKKLFDAKPCLQLQQAYIDCESILMHLQDLEENGPEEALKDIPLESSEIQDEFVFPEDEEELVFADSESISVPGTET